MAFLLWRALCRAWLMPDGFTYIGAWNELLYFLLCLPIDMKPDQGPKEFSGLKASSKDSSQDCFLWKVDSDPSPCSQKESQMPAYLVNILKDLTKRFMRKHNAIHKWILWKSNVMILQQVLLFIHSSSMYWASAVYQALARHSDYRSRGRITQRNLLKYKSRLLWSNESHQ